jgi:hypothetical protein
MANLQKVNLQKSQPKHNLTKMLCLMFLDTGLFGWLTFWRSTISPSIVEPTSIFKGEFKNAWL